MPNHPEGSAPDAWTYGHRTTSAGVTARQRKRTVAALLLAGTLALAACGSSGDPIAGAPTDKVATTATTAPANGSAGADAPSAARGKSELGEILVGANGKTLYGFTNDTAAASTCTGTCADAWPPVIVGEDWSVSPDLDAGIFATAKRDDGTLQLVAGKWPLYFYGGDSAPGDVTGQGSGDVWFAVADDGNLIKPASTPGAGDAGGQADKGAESGAPVIAANNPKLGDLLVNGDGRTLYGFTNDGDGKPSCAGDCAATWPPATTPSRDLPEGLDPKVFSTVKRADGSWQLVAGDWPLYEFSGDSAAGDTNGQGSGGVWFAVAPDGTLVKGAQSKQGSAPSPTKQAPDSGY